MRLSASGKEAGEMLLRCPYRGSALPVYTAMGARPEALKRPSQPFRSTWCQSTSRRFQQRAHVSSLGFSTSWDRQELTCVQPMAVNRRWLTYSQCRWHNLLAVFSDPTLQQFVACNPDSARLPVQVGLPPVVLWPGVDLGARWGPYFICSWCFQILINHFSTYSSSEFTAGIRYHSNWGNITTEACKLCC